jgi:MFS family permease
LTDEPGVAAAERRGFRGRASRLVVDLTPLRRSKAYRRLWFAQGVSFIGTEIAEVALAYQVYQLTGSTLAVGLIALTHLVPLLTLTLIGGAVADAVDRGRLMLVQQVGMLAGSLGLAANAALDQPRVWPLYVLQFVISSSFSLGVGAQRSMTPQLVDEEHFMAASALNSVTSQLGAVAGPALAGVLISSSTCNGSISPIRSPTQARSARSRCCHASSRSRTLSVRICSRLPPGSAMSADSLSFSGSFLSTPTR